MPAAVPQSIWRALHELANGREWPPRDAAEAKRFVEEARGHALLALLFEERDLPPVIAHELEAMSAARFVYRVRRQSFARALTRVAATAGDEPIIYLKGSDYAYRLYDDPSLRPSQDIDILIPLDRAPEMTRRFTAAGFPRFYGEAGRSRLRGYPEIQFDVDGKLVEIHTSMNYRLRAPIDYAAIWERRVPFAAHGGNGFRLADRDAILIHAVNMAKDEFSSPLSRYVDLFLLLRNADEAVLPAVVEDARRWQVQRALYGTLSLAAALIPELDTDATRAARASLLTPRERRWLDRRVLPDPRRERPEHRSGRIRQLWRKLWLIDRPWRRLAYLAFHLYASTAVQVLRLGDRNVNRPHRVLADGTVEVQPDSRG